MNAPAKMTAVQHGVEDGIEWAIVAAPLPGGNGYARIPEGHPWFGKDYDDIYGLTVHYGLTYGSDSSGWVGFDTLHSGDYWPEEELARLGSWSSSYRPGHISDENHWTVERLITETRLLARQIAAAGTDEGRKPYDEIDRLERELAEAKAAADR